MTKLSFVSAPCGGGKTFSAIRQGLRLSGLSENILIVQPSTKLIKQTVANIQKANPSANVYTYHCKDGSEKSVVPRISEHLRSSLPNGEIMLISHAAFELLDFIPNRKNWHVIYDEAPQADYHETFNLNENANLLLDLFDVYDDDDNPLYYALHKKDHIKTQDVAQNVNADQVTQQFSAFARKLRNPHFRMHVLKAQYEHVNANAGVSPGRMQLSISGTLSPSIFDGYASCTMMSACFKESVIYHLWSQRYGVEFVEHKAITNALRYTSHMNGERLTVHYALEGSWSKTVRDIPLDKGGKVIDVMAGEAVKLFKGQPFVFMANKDTSNLFEQDWMAADGVMGRYEQLPNSVHGINEYQGYHNVVIFSALNPTPFHFKYLDDVAGVCSDAVKIAGYRQAVYQACSRTSLRNPDATEPVNAFVPDREAAEFLQSQYPGAQIQRISGFDELQKMIRKAGRPQKYFTDEEKKSATLEKQRERRKLKKISKITRK